MSNYINVNKTMVESLVHIVSMKRERGETTEEIIEFINKLLFKESE